MNHDQALYRLRNLGEPPPSTVQCSQSRRTTIKHCIELSRPDKGKIVKKARKAKYDIRVPRPDIGSSRPPPPFTAPTPSDGSTPPTVGPTPSTIRPSFICRAHTSYYRPTPYILPSPIPTPSSIPSPDVHEPSVNPADPDDLGDPAPHDRPFIEPCGKG
ncbi:hypothetical protein V8G54_015065 [Vigna mungo]|uniref:Uncharacterized protein n=1 Tax=Vigna mungo TaxID=3915 RepID=A0AAQ3NIT8_VIGMU